MRVSRSNTQALSRLSVGITRVPFAARLALPGGRSTSYDAALNASFGVSVQPGVTNGHAMLPIACTRSPVTRGSSEALVGSVKRLNSASKPTSNPRPMRPT